MHSLLISSVGKSVCSGKHSPYFQGHCLQNGIEMDSEVYSRCECVINLSDLYPSYAEDNLGFTEERKSQSIHVLGWKISGPILSHCAFRACYCYSLDQVFYNAEKLLGIQCQLTQR